MVDFYQNIYTKSDGYVPKTMESLNEIDKLWKEAVAENDDLDEWTPPDVRRSPRQLFE